jgi:4-hydroxybenzoate polyprenyltransferase
MIAGLLRSMRPHQWVKNSFVLAPLVFGGQIFAGDVVVQALLAAAAFCALSGSVYLLNDVVDLESDRAHPVKRHRPIASGRVPVRVALGAAAGVATAAFALTGWMLGPATLAVLGAYAVLNLAYSFRLKHIAWFDLQLIALGFVLRVMAGGAATGIEVSPWLFGCTFLLALYLGMGKRLSELRDARTASGATRASLQHYSVERLGAAMNLAAVATTVAYTAYCLSPHARDVFGHGWTPTTVPGIVYGLVRFRILCDRESSGQSPTDRMLTDVPFVINLVVWSLLVLLLLYR